MGFTTERLNYVTVYTRITGVFHQSISILDWRGTPSQHCTDGSPIRAMLHT